MQHTTNQTWSKHASHTCPFSASCRVQVSLTNPLRTTSLTGIVSRPRIFFVSLD